VLLLLLLGEADHPLCDAKDVFIPCVIQGRCLHLLWDSREVFIPCEFQEMCSPIVDFKEVSSKS